MNNINQYIPPPPDVLLQSYELKEWLELSDDPADIHAYMAACDDIEEISTRIAYKQAGDVRLEAIYNSRKSRVQN